MFLLKERPRSGTCSTRSLLMFVKICWSVLKRSALGGYGVAEEAAFVT